MKIQKTDASYHYSGNYSKQFWARVNAIKPEAARHRLYRAGCVLQNLEALMLEDLVRCEAVSKRKLDKPIETKCLTR